MKESVDEKKGLVDIKTNFAKDEAVETLPRSTIRVMDETLEENTL